MEKCKLKFVVYTQIYLFILFIFLWCSTSRGKTIDRVPLPPPRYGSSSMSSSKPSPSSRYRPTAPSVGAARNGGAGVSSSAATPPSCDSSAASNADNLVLFFLDSSLIFLCMCVCVCVMSSFLVGSKVFFFCDRYSFVWFASPIPKIWHSVVVTR